MVRGFAFLISRWLFSVANPDKNAQRRDWFADSEEHEIKQRCLPQKRAALKITSDIFSTCSSPENPGKTSSRQESEKLVFLPSIFRKDLPWKRKSNFPEAVCEGVIAYPQLQIDFNSTDTGSIRVSSEKGNTSHFTLDLRSNSSLESTLRQHRKNIFQPFGAREAERACFHNLMTRQTGSARNITIWWWSGWWWCGEEGGASRRHPERHPGPTPDSARSDGRSASRSAACPSATPEPTRGRSRWAPRSFATRHRSRSPPEGQRRWKCSLQCPMCPIYRFPVLNTQRWRSRNTCTVIRLHLTFHFLNP